MVIKIQIWEVFSEEGTGCVLSCGEDSSGHWFGCLICMLVGADFESLSLRQSETMSIWSPPELYGNAHTKLTHPYAMSRLFLAGAIAVPVSSPN